MEEGEKTLLKGSPKKNKSQISTLVIFVAIIYVVFLLYQSVYFNFQRSQKIKSLRKEIVMLDEKQKKIESLIAYYKTDSFQELEARRKLGLKMPGEKVISVEVKDQKKEEGPSEENNPVVNTKNPKTNLELWIDFISGKQNKI